MVTLQRTSSDFPWPWLKSHSLNLNSLWFLIIMRVKISRVMFNGKDLLKTLIKFSDLKNYKKPCQMKNWILDQPLLIMERDQYLKNNYKQQIESNNFGDSSNCQTDLMLNNSLKIGINWTDSKLHKNNSDKFWRLSDSICLNNKIVPFANYMHQMTKKNQKSDILISWKTQNHMTFLTWLKSNKPSNKELDKNDFTLKMLKKFFKNLEEHPKSID